METSPSPPRPFDFSTPLYFQLVYTLTDLLPPPLDDGPEALHTRNLAAIAKVAALLPVNADEADLAAQCIAARGQAEEMLRLLRENAGDIKLVLRLNAQYASMLRMSLSVHGRLMRVQALRRKRDATGGAANLDPWTQHAAERSMLEVLHADAAQQQAASPKATPVATPVEAPATSPDQKTAENVSETGPDSQDAAFETWLSAKLGNAGGLGETGLHKALREAIANSRSASRELPATGRESPTKAD